MMFNARLLAGYFIENLSIELPPSIINLWAQLGAELTGFISHSYIAHRLRYSRHFPWRSAGISSRLGVRASSLSLSLHGVISLQYIFASHADTIARWHREVLSAGFISLVMRIDICWRHFERNITQAHDYLRRLITPQMPLLFAAHQSSFSFLVLRLLVIVRP